MRFILLFFCVQVVFSQEIQLDVYKTDEHIVLLDSLITSVSGYQKKQDSLITSYINSGYFTVKIDSIVSSLKRKQVYIDFGNKYTYIKINTPISEKLKLEIEKINKVTFTNGFLKIKLKELPKFIFNLKKAFTLDGFSFVSIQLIHFLVENENTIRADISIKKSSIRKIDKIIVKGYPKMPKSFLKRKILKNNNRVFSKLVLSKISDNLKRIPFVEQIRKPEVLFTKDSTIIYTYLKKSKKNYFDGLVGFSTENKQVNFTGHLNLFLQNVFDYGEFFEIKWNKNQKENQDLDIAIHTPYIVTSPIDVDFKANLSKRDSTFLQVNFDFGLSANLHNNHKIGLTYSVLDNRYLLRTNNSDNDGINFYSKFYGIRYIYNKESKNKYIDKNIFFMVTSSIGNRIQSKKKTSQYKLQGILFKSWNLYPKHFLVTKLLAAKLFSNNYLPNEVYRIGGNTTIRGVKQNSLYVTAYTLLNSEYRFYQSKKNYLYAFTDFGYIYNKEKWQKAGSFGIGYSFKTTSGIINLNYAINKIESLPINKGVVSINFKTYF